jgi:NhaA family Na+:H+ antiporter
MKFFSKLFKKSLAPLQEFIRHEQSSGILLLICTVISLVLANTSAGPSILSFWERKAGLTAIGIPLELSLLHWVNDGLMAIFFLLVGLEIKREMVSGELSSVKKSVLPIAGALGGMLVPALIYAVINQGTQYTEGWGIPMATDIAFALAVLSIAGKRVPLGLKVFLTALAIIDDLGAIIVIAVFYTEQLHFLYLGLALGMLGVMMLMNKLKVTSIPLYLLPGLLLWFFLHESGVHSTISGVLTAMTIPLVSKRPDYSPLNKLANILHEPVNYLIMPLFAFANTCIVIDTDAASFLAGTLATGIGLGLIVGKPAGILLFTWLSVKLGWAQLSGGVNWKHMAGVGVLAGIGFTMSIFISLLSFDDDQSQVIAKLSILCASFIAGVVGLLIMKFQHRG